MPQITPLLINPSHQSPQIRPSPDNPALVPISLLIRVAVAGVPAREQGLQAVQGGDWRGQGRDW